MTYRSDKHMHRKKRFKKTPHLTSSRKSRAAKERRKFTTVVPPITSRRSKVLRLRDRKARTQRRLTKGVIRLGDQWTSGRLMYRKVRATLGRELEGRWVAVAAGGVDIVGEPDESKAAFERRVKQLVKPHEHYAPFITVHRPGRKSTRSRRSSMATESDNEEEEDEDEEESEGEAASGDEDEAGARKEAEDAYMTPDEDEEKAAASGEEWVNDGRGRPVPRPPTVPKGEVWVDVD